MGSEPPSFAHAGEIHSSFSFELVILGGALLFLGLSLRRSEGSNRVLPWVLMAGGAITAVAAIATPLLPRTEAASEPPARAAAEPSETADTTPPRITVKEPGKRACGLKPVTVRGAMDEPAAVVVNGRRATVRGTAFRARLDPPPRKLVVRATDDAGNSAVEEVRLKLRRPAIRGVHATAISWGSDALRKPIMKMVKQDLITTVQLDLKDESGVIGYDSKIRRARRIGAVRPSYNLARAVRRLNHLCVRVVGRLVVFRDPILAQAAWRAGKRTEVVQTPGGSPYAGYGGFTNFADPAVVRYNIAVAKEAARAGVDDILYDYVRRPDGDLGQMRFPGLKGSPERAVARFVKQTRRELKRFDVELGLSVFGIAATRPTQIAQDIPRMAKHADYVAPMLYPSHWNRGEYNVASPNTQPYLIVKRSLRDFKKLLRGTGARLVPWLQDFSLGVTYGPRQVKAQMKAARDVGIDEWLLWDPRVTYTEAALR